MVRGVFNILTRLHSREAQIKRFGTPDIVSEIRITPSNYFRNLEGPSHTIVRGREFIIPVDTMLGFNTQLISFSAVPTLGSFHLSYNGTDTASIAFNASAAAIETALQAIAGLEYVTVTGNFTVGFTVKFVGVQNPFVLVAVQEVPALNATITVATSAYVKWSPIIKRGDKIIDPTFGSLAIDEINEMVDLGGSVMGYRCRCE